MRLNAGRMQRLSPDYVALHPDYDSLPAALRCSVHLHQRPCGSTGCRLNRQHTAYRLLNQLVDRIVNGSHLDEIDGMQAIDLVAVALAGPRNQTVVVGANAPPPIAGRMLIQLETHDHVTRSLQGNQPKGMRSWLAKPKRGTALAGSRTAEGVTHRPPISAARLRAARDCGSGSAKCPSRR